MPVIVVLRRQSYEMCVISYIVGPANSKLSTMAVSVSSCPNERASCRLTTYDSRSSQSINKREKTLLRLL